MNLDILKTMWQYLWDFIYEVLAIFGITRDEEGNLVK